MVGEVVPRKSKESVEEDIKRLNEWLEKQPHLPHDVDHELLSVFVQGTKSLEVAKQKLDHYFSNRNRAPKLYDVSYWDASNERFKHLSQAVNEFMLPKTTPDGCLVMVINFTHHLDLFDHPHEAARFMMMIELGMRKWPDAVGYYVVVEFKGASASFAAKINPAIIISILRCYQDGYPIFLRGLYYVNAPPFVEFIANLVKPFMKSKLFEKIKITSEGMSFFKDIIPEEILPCDMGGKEKSSSELNQYWLEELARNKDWFAKILEQVADEDKRPSDGSDTYGVEGTFRKLAVD